MKRLFNVFTIMSMLMLFSITSFSQTDTTIRDDGTVVVKSVITGATVDVPAQFTNSGDAFLDQSSSVDVVDLMRQADGLKTQNMGLMIDLENTNNRFRTCKQNYSEYQQSTNSTISKLKRDKRQLQSQLDSVTTSGDSNPGVTFGLTVGYVFDGPDLDAGVIVFFGNIGVTASYIFDVGDDYDLDYGFKLGIGNRVSEKYTVFANVINLTGYDTDYSFGVDVSYNLLENLAISIGAETQRGVRIGSYFTF